MNLAADCYAPWGARVVEGGSVQAYYNSNPRAGERCRSEYRTCRNNYLSGSYRYQSCREDNGCQTEFGYIPNGGSVTAFLNSTETGGRQCQSEIRRCSYGRFSGSYRYRSCQSL